MTPLQKLIRREIVALALPVVLSSLLQRFVSIVDIFLVGGLGASAIAAVGIGQLLVFISLTLIWGLSSGTTVIVAQFYGAGRRQQASHIAFQSLLLGIVLSLLIGLIGLKFGHQGAVFLGAEPAVADLSAGYIRIIFAAFGFTALVNLLCNILFGTGDTRTPLVIVVLINLLHILIAYPLIYGHWGAPAIGINGAAIAIAVSEGIGAMLLLAVVHRRGVIRVGGIHPALLRDVIRVGLPVFGDRVLQQAGQTIYLKIIMLYGTAAYAAHQVGLSIEALSFMPGYGLSIAVTTAVGQSLGANRPDRAQWINWEANRFAVMLMAGMGAVFFFFPYLLLRLFTEDAEVIAYGTSFLKIVALLQVPLAITMVLSGSLKGAGDTGYLLMTTIVGSWLVRVPVAYLLAVVLTLPIQYVWSVMILDWVVRMVLLLIRYRSDRWRRAVLTNTEAAHGIPH